MSVPTSKIFTGLFAFTTLVFGGVAYYLYQKVRRQKVNLSGGSMA
jgi:cbb3-type cytochrome oxidase subunit 3